LFLFASSVVESANCAAARMAPVGLLIW
jgi:hypothetical protein